jgi:hypothetical protein
MSNSGFRRSRLAFAILLAIGSAMSGLNGQASATNAPSVFGVFAGSSPCGDAIRQLLRIPSDVAADLVQWKLTLYQDPKTLAPSRYELRYEYGATASGKPGLAAGVRTQQQQGAWSIGKGITSNPDAIVYELNGAVSLVQVDANILHVLNPDRSLMTGNGGWSYVLNRTEQSEKSVHPMLARFQPDMSYRISPLATGPTVFGVFEGRSPCQGIARELKIPVAAACTKAKWRVTLYQDPETLAPTVYKVEGSLQPRGAREGSWTLMRGTQQDPNAIVYRLEPTRTEPALLLLKGDDNVLFLLDQNRRPLVGHGDFSYALNRRGAAGAS